MLDRSKTPQRQHIKNPQLYDPPEGWRFGFPRPYLPYEGETVEDTLRRDGYPEKMMHLAKYTRFLG